MMYNNDIRIEASFHTLELIDKVGRLFGVDEEAIYRTIENICEKSLELYQSIQQSLDMYEKLFEFISLEVEPKKIRESKLLRDAQRLEKSLRRW